MLLWVSVATFVMVGVTAPPANALTKRQIEDSQVRLNRLGCNAGRPDGIAGPRTRAGVVRFQAANRLQQDGYLTPATRRAVHASSAKRCDVRPKPARSGSGRRIILSQRQNWLWLVSASGRVVAQGGLIDNPSALPRGRYWTGPKCGRAGRIRNNSDYSGSLVLHNFVRFAPCGIGFHQVPTRRSTGRQIHPNWLLGTNYRESHGCIRVSRWMSERIWDFTTSRTKVVVVRG
ncbi:MAG: L,D-transpeptidase family protein [Nitriliruptorales bacterium]|nr:L,D-transpeptidase family protein [Nitriliruptorales bacterium]